MKTLHLPLAEIKTIKTKLHLFLFKRAFTVELLHLTETITLIVTTGERKLNNIEQVRIQTKH